MAPLIRECQKYSDKLSAIVCLTGQHRTMLDQINTFFGITGDYDLDIMQQNQTLFDIVCNSLLKSKDLIPQIVPDAIFIQGDTSAVLAGFLAAYFCKIPLMHLEAGLLSGDKYSPFPGEMNRILSGYIADYHFAPTRQTVNNLKKENIIDNVYMVGNTGIDALYLGLDIIKKSGEKEYKKFFTFIDFSKKIIFVTGHHRENFGDGFKEICRSLVWISERNDVQIVYPMHLNPNVREPVINYLSGKSNIHLIDPLDYPYLIWLMEKGFLVLTDSGGIQEEAPALGKPVLVMRNVTARLEGIEAGTAKLVGTDFDLITSNVISLLTDSAAYNSMSNMVNPYGDGTTSKKIVDILLTEC